MEKKKASVSTLKDEMVETLTARLKKEVIF